MNNQKGNCRNLVDGIRGMVRDASARGMYPVFTDAASDLLGRSCLSKDDESELFTTIADRIEREYLPRPRFEDGELVDVEDEIDVNGTRVKVKSYVVDYDGLTTFLDGKKTLGYDLEPGNPAKRPNPEVLDADGVSIKVGDHVWWKDGREFVITAVNRGVNTEAVEPVPGMCSSHVNFDPKEFTHKQPDTLERIEEELEEAFRRFFCPSDDFGPDAINGEKLQETVKNLLRRQQALFSCLKCGKEHIGFEGTKEANDD